jgi:hypothetical protein
MVPTSKRTLGAAAGLGAALATAVIVLGAPRPSGPVGAETRCADPLAAVESVTAIGMRTSADPALSRDVDSPAALRAFVAACERAGTESLGRLRELAQSDDPLVASHAVRALGRLAPGCAPVIVDRLANGPPAVRQAAVQALGSTGDEAALAYLQPLLQDSDPTLRRLAIAAIGRVGSESGRQILHRWESEVVDLVDRAFLRAALAPPTSFRTYRGEAGSVRRVEVVAPR